MLREELGFEGVILSDDLEMKAIAATYSVPGRGGAGDRRRLRRPTDLPQLTKDRQDAQASARC